MFLNLFIFLFFFFPIAKCINAKNHQLRYKSRITNANSLPLEISPPSALARVRMGATIFILFLFLFFIFSPSTKYINAKIDYKIIYKSRTNNANLLPLQISVPSQGQDARRNSYFDFLFLFDFFFFLSPFKIRSS